MHFLVTVIYFHWIRKKHKYNIGYMRVQAESIEDSLFY